MDKVKENHQRLLNCDKAIVARVRRLQEAESLTFEEAAEIVHINLLGNRYDC